MEVSTIITETERVVIKQGKPTSQYFYIILPVPGTPLSVGQPITCVNPKTGIMVDAEVTEHFWIIDWNEPPRGFLFGIYGIEPKLLRIVLQQRDEAFGDNWARIILVKETK